MAGPPPTPGQPAANVAPGAPQAVRPTSPPVTGAGTPTTGARLVPGAPPTAPPRPTIEGLRAWVSDLDRKVGLRTYLGIAAIILALASSAVAIVLAIDARDNSADNDDLNAISARVNEIESGAPADFDATAFEARLTAIEDQLSSAGDSAGGGNAAERLDVLENDIEELRNQISDLESPGGSP